MRIIEHKLDGVPFEATPNMGAVIHPELLIVHYTVVTTMRGTVEAFKAPSSKASAHIVMDLDGRMTQMVPFNHKAWHAGESEWNGRAGCNNFSIGIEIVNPGPLERRTDGFYDVNGLRWGGEIAEGKHKNGRANWSFWAAYRAEQLAALRQVGSLLVAEYGLREVVGHDDVAPTRKIDPGPAFPLETYRGALFGRANDGPEEYETTAVVNIRKGPGTMFDTVPSSPLLKGARLRVAEQEGQWWHVVNSTASQEGWVHARFLVRAVEV